MHNSAMNFKQNLLFEVALKYQLVTDDPFVNHMVDNHMGDMSLPFNQELEDETIKSHRRTGGMILSLSIENWGGN